MLRAARAAKACALTTAAPFLQLLVVPRWRNKAYDSELLDHPSCHMLATVPRKYFHFVKASYSPSAWDPTHPDFDPFVAGPTPPAGPPAAAHPHAKWPLRLVLIFNDAGLQQLCNRGALPALQEALVAHAVSTCPPPSGRPADAAYAAAVRRLLAFAPPPLAAPAVNVAHVHWARRFLARCMPGAPERPYPRLPATPVDDPTPLPPASACPAPPRRFAPATIVYTDASKAPHSAGMGCGVYIPFASDPAARCHSFFVPRPKAHIVLGELMAIWRAVQLAPTAGPLHVLTDSLTSLYMISRAARRPASLHSPHAALLHAIVAAVCQRTGPTLLQKVRAHVGIVGNEIADRLAAAGCALADSLADHALPPPAPPDALFSVYELPPPPAAAPAPLAPRALPDDWAFSCRTCARPLASGDLHFDLLDALPALQAALGGGDAAATEALGLDACCIRALRSRAARLSRPTGGCFCCTSTGAPVLRLPSVAPGPLGPAPLPPAPPPAQPAVAPSFSVDPATGAPILTIPVPRPPLPPLTTPTVGAPSTTAATLEYVVSRTLVGRAAT